MSRVIWSGGNMSRVIWILKQLLPLTYRSKYKEDGKAVFCVWNMWFGRSYNIQKYYIIEE